MSTIHHALQAHSQQKRLVVLALACTAMTLCACSMQGDAAKPEPYRSSFYDPMKDMATGDDLPAVPSVNQITPDQVMGTGNSGVIFPGAAVSSAGAGRR